MITATYRALSTRLREHVNASETVQEDVEYIGEDIGSPCESVLVHNGTQIASRLAPGERLAEDVTMAHNRLHDEKTPSSNALR